MKKVTIIGSGWLGFALAQALQEHYHVRASWRSDATRLKLEQAGLSTLHVDLAKGILPEALFDTDALCLFIPPSRNPDIVYATLFQKLVSHPKFAAIRQLIFSSSTSVYAPQPNPKDEQAATLDTHPILEAETLLRTHKRFCTLRLAGLMGSGRYLAKYYPCERTLADAPVNHLHQDDAIGLIKTVIERQICGTYNLCAPLHPMKSAVIKTQCRQLRTAPPNFEKEAGATAIIEGGALVAKTGYTFLWPDPADFPL